MKEQTTLILKNDVSELDRVMSFVSDLCVRNSVPPDIEYDIDLALDEMIPAKEDCLNSQESSTFTTNAIVGRSV